MSSEYTAEEKEELRGFLNGLQDLEGLGPEDIAGLKRIVGGEEPLDLESEFIDESKAAEEEAASAVAEPEAEEEEEEENRDLRAQIADMNVPQKMKLAMFGNSICRMLLITDKNRLIPQCVLKNPKLQMSEVEAFSKNSQIADYVLREIGGNKKWVKLYIIKLNLVMNPKTPQDVALKWLRYLRKSELRRIARSKNLPQIVAMTARKMLAHMEQKGQSQ